MKVAIYSLGCKVNIYESEYVLSLLKNHDYEIVSFDEVADIYIINTCSVTNESDKKSRKVIRQARKKNKDAIIVVMGCYSQVQSDKIDADIILGNQDKSQILFYLDKFRKDRYPIKKIYDLRDNIAFERMFITNFDNHTRAFVKIQDGCNAFCSYCIIPFTRGRVRSKQFDDVIQEVSMLVENGYREIVLTGIHTGKYGIDLENMNLEKLLRRLICIPNLYRIRLSSIEINEITDGIMDLMKESDIIASHLHIPLQSGSDSILKAMNRRYTVNEFVSKIEKIRKLRNDISITTDLIVGFPGESDENFNETLETLKKIRFTKIHTFPYSQRNGTVASEMKEQIDGNVKKRRVKKILQLSDEFEKEYYERYKGEVLEGVSEFRKDGKTVIHTTNFIPVIIEDFPYNNYIVKVKIVYVSDDHVVYGEVVSSFKNVSIESKKD